ncbi:MAG: hypothetical protein ACKPKO_11575, partial [Candidatus Fonsibacter sp.]
MIKLCEIQVLLARGAPGNNNWPTLGLQLVYSWSTLGLQLIDMSSRHHVSSFSLFGDFAHVVSSMF